MAWWGKKSLVVVTGASQGIGRAIVVAFSRKVGAGSRFVLTARSAEKLQETASLAASEGVKFVVEPMNMEKPDTNALIKSMDDEKYDLYMIVHNAGTEGNGDLTSEMTSIPEWTRYMTLNMFSAAALTGAFWKTVPTDSKILLINITSLAAVKPIAGLGYYCIGKAAREMYFNTLAEENKNVQVLNYSPGPVDTEMQTRVTSVLKVGETKDMFTSMRTNKVLLSLDQSVGKLVGLLDKGFDASPLRVDYFD